MLKITTGGRISVAGVRVVVISIISFRAGRSSMGAPLATPFACVADIASSQI
jgi:hypothetical protein